MKRVLSIQDISCVGKCSLTVAMPILSAAGLETCVLPTAVLSTHTAFQHFTFRDLTGDIPGIEEAWEQEHIQFDAVYTGYLGSPEQVRLVLDVVNRFLKPGGTFICDPAMADNGQLYSGFSAEFPQTMAELCRYADICMPNLTEAALLLGKDYIPDGYDRPYIEQILRDLADRGTTVPVLTGVSLSLGYLGTMAFDSRTGTFEECYTRREPQNFHGTGDLFASVFTAAWERGKTLKNSLQIAAEVTHAAICRTLTDPDPAWYGVNYEEAIPYFLQLLK